MQFGVRASARISCVCVPEENICQNKKHFGQMRPTASNPCACQEKQNIQAAPHVSSGCWFPSFCQGIIIILRNPLGAPSTRKKTLGLGRTRKQNMPKAMISSRKRTPQHTEKNICLFPGSRIPCACGPQTTNQLRVPLSGIR